MNTLDRRAFFCQFARRLAAAVCDASVAAQAPATREAAPLPKPHPAWFRPPGALPEDDFRAACTRCTDCIQACPHQSIRRLGPEWGADAGTPAIIPAQSPCYLCAQMPCIPACSPGALQPVAPTDVRMGSAVIRYDACYQAQGQPCDYCFTRCPLKGQAITLGPARRPLVHHERCTGCGVCAYLCPAGAIDLVPPSSNERNPR